MVNIGNFVAILFAVILNGIGHKYPKTTGDGVLMSGFSNEDATKVYSYNMTLGDLAAGLLIGGGFVLFGLIVGSFIPAIHYYAFTIVAVAACKITGIIPERLEFGAVKWYRFMIDHFTIIIMGGVGLAMLSIADLLKVLTLSYLSVATAVVIGSVIGAGLCGLLVKFYFVESAITAGLDMAGAGGNGDIMILSACGRMQLMCFAQISSRLGGGLILVIQSILALILLK